MMTPTPAPSDGTLKPMPWHDQWVRLNLLIRALLAVRYTPEVKEALRRCVELRRLLIRAGAFN